MNEPTLARSTERPPYLLVGVYTSTAGLAGIPTLTHSASVLIPGSLGALHDAVAQQLERSGITMDGVPAGAQSNPWCAIVDLEPGSLPPGPAFWEQCVIELADIVSGAVAERTVVPLAAVRSALCTLPQGRLRVAVEFLAIA